MYTLEQVDCTSYFFNSAYTRRGNTRYRGKYVNICFIILGVACLIPVIIIVSGGVY